MQETIRFESTHESTFEWHPSLSNSPGGIHKYWCWKAAIETNSSIHTFILTRARECASELRAREEGGGSESPPPANSAPMKAIYNRQLFTECDLVEDLNHVHFFVTLGQYHQGQIN